MQSAKRAEPIQPTEDELVGALDALEVPFLRGGVRNNIALALTPHELMAGLAQSNHARMCYAIIPLLLRHPELAQEASIADAQLQGKPRETLELYYTAAMVLQKKFQERLKSLFGTQPILPDLFCSALNIECSDNVKESLERLGKRHAESSGLDINWVGSYLHAATTCSSMSSYAENGENGERGRPCRRSANRGVPSRVGESLSPAHDTLLGWRQRAHSFRQQPSDFGY